MDEEAIVTCPWCWQDTAVLVDLLPGGHEFVWDCGVCCRPMAVRALIEDGAIAAIDVVPAE